MSTDADAERRRNEHAFTVERFRMVGDRAQNGRVQSGIRVERLQSIASVVRNQLLVQVIEADLHAADVQAVDMHAVDPRPQVQLTLVSQEMRQRDLALIMSQVGPSIGIELAALAYLEADGDVVSAIVSLVDGSGRRAQLEERLRERMAQLGRRVADSEGGDGGAELTEEWREALHDARRAFMDIATQRRAEQLEEQAREEAAISAAMGSTSLADAAEPPPAPSGVLGGDCVICLEHASTHVAVPCGHFCLCADCTKDLALCPMCRAPFCATTGCMLVGSPTITWAVVE